MKNENVSEYTIMEYNQKTMKYIAIGYAFGKTSEEAKLNYIKDNRWRASRDILLFARLPLCR
tara:strand:- start:511 stop:696 length:186 start_codon:yes stop_codon:yes gene_type:complete